jgi:ribosomal protein S18 acetylase RimI-like enzyme
MASDDDAIEFVQAGSGDAQAILPLMVAFNAFEGIAWEPQSKVAAFERLLRDPKLGFVLIARRHGSADVLGYGLATYNYDLEFAGVDAFITEIFVAEPHRGQGLGRALLDATVEKLREQGTTAVHLVVRPENERARALYEAHGFRLVPRVMMTKVLTGS